MPSHDGRRRLGRLSLRLRRTLWVIAVVVLIPTALAAVAVLYQRQAARRSLDQHLALRARVLAREVELPAEPLRLQARAATESASDQFDSFALAVFDAAARPIAATERPP